MRTRIALVSVILTVLVLSFQINVKPLGASANQVVQKSCTLPESNAESLTYYQSSDFIWDHTNLTVAVQAHPNATQEQLVAIQGAIATWSAVLLECFDGLITLTDVTGTLPNAHQAADIVVHFVPSGLGFAFGGYTICGDHSCPNVFIRSDYPPGLYGQDFSVSPEFLMSITLHELGHALGLGHATNLIDSNDLMGYGWVYGWYVPGIRPVLSDCDLDALATVFSWAFEGSPPHAPAEEPFSCS